MAACNILMYSINFSDDVIIEDVIEKLEKNSLEDTRVIVDEYDNDSIAGTYIYSEINKVREYNFKKNIFEFITETRYVAVEFHFNFKYKYLDVWGSQKNAQRVITVISLTFNNNISIEPSYFDFMKIIDYLKKKDYVYVNRVVANGLSIEKDLIADCSFNLTGKEKPFNIIDKYKNNIQKVSFKWKCENQILSIVIYKTGVITIHKQRHLIDNEELNNLYQMLMYARR